MKRPLSYNHCPSGLDFYHCSGWAWRMSACCHGAITDLKLSFKTPSCCKVFPCVSKLSRSIGTEMNSVLIDFFSNMAFHGSLSLCRAIQLMVKLMLVVLTRSHIISHHISCKCIPKTDNTFVLTPKSNLLWRRAPKCIFCGPHTFILQYNRVLAVLLVSYRT